MHSWGNNDHRRLGTIAVSLSTLLLLIGIVSSPSNFLSIGGDIRDKRCGGQSGCKINGDNTHEQQSQLMRDVRGEQQDNFVYESINATHRAFITNNKIAPVDEKISNFTLHFVAERHSGSTWISSRLMRCFRGTAVEHVRPHFYRWKHWFQKEIDDSLVPEDKAETRVVFAQFRNPYDWVWAMNKKPYHTPRHKHLPWLEFVNRKWYMAPYSLDTKTNATSLRRLGIGGRNGPCKSAFFPNEIVPCMAPGKTISFNDVDQRRGDRSRPMYELRFDGSGRPYNNILEMRADKIRNFMNMSNFKSLYHFDAVQYEGLIAEGRNTIVRKIEEITGIKAHDKCRGESSLRPIERYPYTAEFVDYLNKHMDWTAEELIGYKRLDPSDFPSEPEGLRYQYQQN